MIMNRRRGPVYIFMEISVQFHHLDAPDRYTKHIREIMGLADANGRDKAHQPVSVDLENATLKLLMDKVLTLSWKESRGNSTKNPSFNCVPHDCWDYMQGKRIHFVSWSNLKLRFALLVALLRKGCCRHILRERRRSPPEKSRGE
jgi:hypothetical protein